MARKKSKPWRPVSPWDADGNTGTKDARGRPIRAPLARPALDAAAIEEREVDLDTGRDATTKTPVWKRRPSAVIAALPEADREALAHYVDLVGRVDASAGTLDPTGQGGTPATPTGPSLSRLAAAESLRRVHLALAGRFVEVRRFGRTPERVMPYRELIDAVALAEVSPKEIARRIARTPSGRPSEPALYGVQSAVPLAAAIVATALGHRDGDGAK